MCNRVRASFEFREIRIRWNLFNDLPGFKPAYNIVPDRGDIIAVVQNEAGNEGRFMSGRGACFEIISRNQRIHSHMFACRGEPHKDGASNPVTVAIV